MKPLKKILLLGIVIYLLAIPLFSQTPRTLIELHGFGTGANGWQVYDSIFEARYSNLSAFFFKYNNLDGVQIASEDILDKINDPNTVGLGGQIVSPGPDNILIAHSTGGLAARMMEHHPNQALRAQMSNYFGGYITVGSPHQGINLVNSFENGDLEIWFAGGCKQVVEDPVNALTVGIGSLTSGWYGQIAGLLVVDDFTNVLCTSGYNTITDALSVFTAPQTLQDLKVGSTSLNLPTTSNKYRINIYGDEQSPVHWRFLSSLKNENMPVSINPAIPYVARDGDIGKDANTVKGVLTGLAVATGTVSLVSSFFGNFYASATFGLASLQSLEGRAWIVNSESAWNELIDANGWFTTNRQVNIFQCQAALDQLVFDFHVDGAFDVFQYRQQRNAILQNPNCWTTVTQTIRIANNKVSDGLAPKATTRSDPTVCLLRMADANHQEEVHHPSATAIYIGILEQDNNIVGACNDQVTTAFFRIN